MKTFHILILALLLVSGTAYAKVAKTLSYHVNLNDRSDDTFKVKVRVNNLKPENAVYQFASTAPGAYQVMDMGKYVRSFEAFDKKGEKLKTKRISTNQWKIENVAKATEIRYSIAETWDTPMTADPIDLMCGSSLENDHALINGQAVFGFPSGMQSIPLDITISHPAAWRVGTALEADSIGVFHAKNYDHIVDSPILLGRLTKAETQVRGAKIEIYTYSKTDKVKSEQLLGAMQTMLTAAGDFIKEMPVQRYTFLYHFEDQTYGAWEHSYSSEYVFEEEEYTPQLGKFVTDIAAHEFFHIVIPLNVHSEIIEKFNFVTPTASEHLWLYEGVTEWAAHAMQLRSGLKTITAYLTDISQKIGTDATLYDRNCSLSRLSLTSYTRDGQLQYGNIYQRGALVAGLLDIRLLELSGGKRGLREVVMELAKLYGPNQPFPEKTFIEEFVKLTYPEIAVFFEHYVHHANPLPIKEYYEKLGIIYRETLITDQDLSDAGFKVTGLPGKLVITDYLNTLTTIDGAGLRENDTIIGLNGESVTTINAKQFMALLLKRDIGKAYSLTLLRGGKNLTLHLTMNSRKEEQYHLFELAANPYKRQLALRAAWMRNL